ncbi:hypothetical protein D3C78_1932640 [compost metagenome]
MISAKYAASKRVKVMNAVLVGPNGIGRPSGLINCRMVGIRKNNQNSTRISGIERITAT